MDSEKNHPLLKNLNEHARNIIDKFPKAIKDFYMFHGPQLYGSSFPLDLVEVLYDKLSKEVYDVGEFFQIMDNEPENTFQVKALKDIKGGSNVFVIDHALTFKYPDFRRLLMENSSLIPRLNQILKYQKTIKQLPGIEKPENKPIGVAQNFTQIQFDSMQLKQLSHLQFPNNTVTLSLMNNQLTDQEELIKKMEYLNLKVLWLNNNPIQVGQRIIEYVENASKIQIFNSKFTKNCTEWGLKFVQAMDMNYAFNENNNNIYRLNLDGRQVFTIDIRIFEKFPNLTVLSLKEHSLSAQEEKQQMIHILQNNKNLRYLYLDYEAETTLFEIFNEKTFPKEIFNNILVNGHSFFCKETTLMENQVDQIHQNIFKLTGTYRLASTQQLDQSSIWYLNDEVGCSIQHNDDPNVKVIPFLYASDNKLGPNTIAFSLIWPVKDIKSDDNLYRDYLSGYTEERQRSSRLAIWYNVPSNFFRTRFQQFESKQLQLEKQTANKIMEFYKVNTQKQKQQIKILSESGQLYPEELNLLSDNQTVLDHMTLKQIKFVKNLEDTNIIWMSSAFDDEKWNEIKDKYYLNQFPYESCVVLKQNLANTVQSIFGKTNFLMRTYNLETELPEFIGDFKNRQSHGEDNLWILKPPNLARSMDMIITDNLSLIIKSMETGPRIAQKYIQRPVLRRNKKIDLRYIILVKSISPLTLMLYKHFWIRSSNNTYNLDRRYLSTYQTQFTVMNYGQVTDFKQIPYKQFIEEFEKDYAPTKWTQIDGKIKKMLRNTFIAASLKYPEMSNEKSRAIYGVDIMIDEGSMQPKLLEITFSPDCKRACDYYPSFYNQVFESLFLNVNGENMERII